MLQLKGLTPTGLLPQGALQEGSISLKEGQFVKTDGRTAGWIGRGLARALTELCLYPTHPLRLIRLLQSYIFLRVAFSLACTQRARMIACVLSF